MINYTWEIIKIFSKEDLITEIKYKLIGNNQIITIEILRKKSLLSAKVYILSIIIASSM